MGECYQWQAQTRPSPRNWRSGRGETQLGGPILTFRSPFERRILQCGNDTQSLVLCWPISGWSRAASNHQRGSYPYSIRPNLV